MIEGTKAIQRIAARMHEGWYKEAQKELATRAEEEAVRKWVGAVWEVWSGAEYMWEEGGSGVRVAREWEREAAANTDVPEREQGTTEVV